MALTSTIAERQTLDRTTNGRTRGQKERSGDTSSDALGIAREKTDRSFRLQKARGEIGRRQRCVLGRRGLWRQRDT